MAWPLILFLAWFPLAAMGQIASGAGRVSASIEFADGDLIVVSVRASGKDQADLIGLDGATGALRWRCPNVGNDYAAHSDNTNEIYEINSGRLAARSRSDGVVLWAIKLSSLRWPKAGVSVEEMQRSGLIRHKVLAFHPSSYSYSLVVNREQFVVIRTGLSGGGDSFRIEGQDWASLDRGSGKAHSGKCVGEGSLVAATRDAVLMKGDGNSLHELSHKKVHDISSQVGSVRMYDGMSRSYYYGEVHERFCTFRFAVPAGYATGQEDYVYCDTLAVYDGSNHRITVINPAPRHDYQVKVVNSDRYVLRFAEGVGYKKDEDESKRNRMPFWIESYATDGRLIGELTLPTPYEPAGRFSRGLWSRGVMADGGFVFAEVVYSIDSNTGRGTEAYDRVVIVDPAVPRVTRLMDLSTGGRASSNIHMAAGTDMAIQVFGECEVEKMDTPEEDRELLVRAISLRSGAEIWRDSEMVKMRRTQ